MKAKTSKLAFTYIGSVKSVHTSSGQNNSNTHHGMCYVGGGRPYFYVPYGSSASANCYTAEVQMPTPVIPSASIRAKLDAWAHRTRNTTAGSDYLACVNSIPAYTVINPAVDLLAGCDLSLITGTGVKAENIADYRCKGLAVVDGADIGAGLSGRRIIVNIRRWYAVNNNHHPNVIMRDLLHLGTANFAGPYRLGPDTSHTAHNGAAGGLAYMPGGEPALGGASLLTGQFNADGQDTTVETPIPAVGFKMTNVGPAGTVIPSLKLSWIPNNGDPDPLNPQVGYPALRNDWIDPVWDVPAGWRNRNIFGSQVIVETANTRCVVYVGAWGRHNSYCLPSILTPGHIDYCPDKTRGRFLYGWPNYGGKDYAYCVNDKGYHGGPYQPVYFLADVQEFVDVYNGTKAPGDARHYGLLFPNEDTPNQWGRHWWGHCYNLPSGAMYDTDNQVLWVCEHLGYDDFGSRPVFHAYAVADIPDGSTPPPPVTVSYRAKFRK